MPVIQETNDAAENRGTLYALENGDTFLGRLDTEDALDWVRVDLSQNHSYLFSSFGDGAANAASRFDLTLFNDAGDVVEQRVGVAPVAGQQPGANLWVSPTVSGTYWLQMGTGSDQLGGAGDYGVTMVREIADNRATMAHIAPGQSTMGRNEHIADRDWYRVDLRADLGYVFRMEGAGANAVAATTLALHDASGTPIATATGELAQTPIQSGVYYISAGAADLSQNSVGDYRLSMIQEIANTDRTSAAIDPGETVRSWLDTETDVDVFRIQMAAGDSYQIALAPTPGSQITRADLAVRSSGVDAAELDAPGVTPSQTYLYTATYGGTHFIEVGGAGGPGGYALRVSGPRTEGHDGPDLLEGTILNNLIYGFDGNDTLRGNGGDDTLVGGDDADVLSGGAGNDVLLGGDTARDRADTIFGGDGNDRAEAGYGDDSVYGMNGDDTLVGGFGVDTLAGQDGNDVLAGEAGNDALFGNAGDDFVNGGFGSDRINGGTGADRFFHVGDLGHGSDWVQDYTSAEGDILLYGGTATRDQFQLNFANSAGAGEAGVAEAFVIFRPTDQILWALVDGAGEDEITLRLNGQDFDLLA